MSHPNASIVREILSFSSGYLARIAGSPRYEDIDALVSDWVEAITSPDAPLFSGWASSWNWYTAQRRAEYPDECTLSIP